MELLWLVIVILLAIIEVATVNLVCIWFIASGLISLLLALLNLPFIFQITSFVILGIFFLMLTKKDFKRILDKTKQKTNLDVVIGKEAIVTENISKNKPGEVKINGKRWTAIASKSIKKDTIVKVLKIEGVKLIVEEV